MGLTSTMLSPSDSATVQTLLDLRPNPSEEVEAMNKLTDYLQTAEAAEILGVAQNTIRTWAAAGKIPMHRNPANGYRLFRRSDLRKFLRETAKPVTPAKVKKAK